MGFVRTVHLTNHFPCHFPMSHDDSTTIPVVFCCPITKALMKDPVLMKDGCTYERTAIAQALGRNPASPITRAPLSMNDAVPNRALRDAIERFISKSFSILVKWSLSGRNSQGQIETCLKDTVLNLKTKVAALTKLPQESLKLKFGDDVLENDEETVADLSIRPQDQINVECPLTQIFVRSTAGTDAIRVWPVETVKDLKLKIFDRRGLQPEEQILIYQGKPLDNDKKPLGTYHLEAGSTINVALRVVGGLTMK
jgi:hypothetical protein